MNRRIQIILVAALVTLVIAPGVSASRIPSVNLAISLKAEKDIYPFPVERIIDNLERELRLKGFLGRFRALENEADGIVSGETLVRITITRNIWETRKAFSIPYLLNRYRRLYVLELYLEIPTGSNGMFAKMIRASGSTGVQAQFISNDAYDPDIFPDQTERCKIENKTCRNLAKKLSKRLLANLR